MATPSLHAALSELRAHPLRAALSTLGIVMGTGALVSVLAIGDGVRLFAQEQIATTTDLLIVTVSPRTSVVLDGHPVPREDTLRLSEDGVRRLVRGLPNVARWTLMTRGSVPAWGPGSREPRGLAVSAVLPEHFESAGWKVVSGALFSRRDAAALRAQSEFDGDRVPPVVLSDEAAALLGIEPRGADVTVSLAGRVHQVVGVVTGGADAQGPLAFVPLAGAAGALGRDGVPSLYLEATEVGAVPVLRDRVTAELRRVFGSDVEERVVVTTNQARVAQAATAMGVFKMLVGSVAGVSLAVGGVGIMNVLLAAVAERTREIGIRRAVGARRSDLIAQFLTEAVTITTLGAAAGTALGIGVAHLAAWIMRIRLNAPVEATLTVGTVLLAVGCSMVIGLIFGLYPALRASRLTPIDALRSE